MLSRGGHVTNVLFLADRTALVKQAKDDFRTLSAGPVASILLLQGR